LLAPRLGEMSPQETEGAVEHPQKRKAHLMDDPQRSSPAIYARARELRKAQTPIERRLWWRLRKRQLDGLHFRRQHPIGPFIVDFYCDKHRLIIELDGPSHDEQVEYDEERTAWLEACGYRVIRFANKQVRNNLEGVLEAILMCCAGK